MLIYILFLYINFIYAYNGYITHYNEYEWYPVNNSGEMRNQHFGCSVNNKYINDTKYSVAIALPKYWKEKKKCGSCICINYNNKKICARFLDYIGDNKNHNNYHLDLTLSLYKSITK